jgi:hypothetical protein
LLLSLVGEHWSWKHLKVVPHEVILKEGGR